MKRIKRTIFLSVLVLFFFFFCPAQPTKAQECYEHARSCDASKPCCDFPDWKCEGGYCKQGGTMCGKSPLPCCSAPNPPCIPSESCNSGYCGNSPTATPIPTSTPSCGMPFTQPCCSTEPKCVSPYGGSIMTCQGGHCLPQTTTCGLLGKPCCPPPDPPCRVTNVVCDRNGYCNAITPIPEGECSANGTTGINTALGCIPTNDMNSFVAWLLGKLVAISGGIAFLLIAFGVFQITTSAGDPKKVQAGSELITSALSGLLFIILSLFLLKLIGVDILHLPGFGP